MELKMSWVLYESWSKSCAKRSKDKGTFEASKYLNLFNLEAIVEINPKFRRGSAEEEPRNTPFMNV